MNSLNSNFDRPFTLHDVLTWATGDAETYAAICELKKIPARLGMIDEDIGLIPADLEYFEIHVAPSAYGAVSKARDLRSARQRGNARVRALLKRFQGAMTSGGNDEQGRSDWDKLIGFVQEREGFLDRGATFGTGTSRGLMMLRARFTNAPRDISADQVDQVARELSAEKRKALRRALSTLNRLIDGFGSSPGLAGLLPDVPVALPEPVSTAKRMSWNSLPQVFRTDAEAVMNRALARPEDRMEEARARLSAGEDAERVLRDLDDAAAGRKRTPNNPDSAMMSWRGAITWLVRAAESRGTAAADLKTLEELFTADIIEGACSDQIERSVSSHCLRAPEETQTLKTRLVGLETLAKHGLNRPDLTAEVELQKRFHVAYLRGSDTGMREDVKRLCDALSHRPSLAASFVNAPRQIAQRADDQIKLARREGNTRMEVAGLRLFAAAVLFAVQVSRPVRSSNLIRLRYRGTSRASGHVNWVRKRKHAELRFRPGEIKNDREVCVHLLGQEADILWTWMSDLRPRYIELRALKDTPYVLPGEATPRLVKMGLTLPWGCVSPSTLSEIWRDGADIIGLKMTPHQSRHAIATLILAVEPGNFAKAGAVLGDTEETVRKHYGRDSGAEAARQVRVALKTRHPEIFNLMKRRVS